MRVLGTYGDVTFDHMWLQIMDLVIWSAVKEWLSLSACTYDAFLYSRLSGLILRVQACLLHQIAHSLGNNIKSVVCHEGLENEFKKLWIAAEEGGRGRENLIDLGPKGSHGLWDPSLRIGDFHSEGHLSKTLWLVKARIF